MVWRFAELENPGHCASLAPRLPVVLLLLAALTLGGCAGKRQTVKDDPAWRVPMAPKESMAANAFDKGPPSQPVDFGTDLLEFSTLDAKARRSLPGAVDDRTWVPGLPEEQANDADEGGDGSASSESKAAAGGFGAEFARTRAATSPAGRRAATGAEAASPVPPPAASWGDPDLIRVGD